MPKQPIHQRITEMVASDQWHTLKQVCDAIGSKSYSYVKMTLFAMPNVRCRRVMSISETDAPSSRFPEEKRWKWQFKVSVFND